MFAYDCHHAARTAYTIRTSPNVVVVARVAMCRDSCESRAGDGACVEGAGRCEDRIVNGPSRSASPVLGTRPKYSTRMASSCPEVMPSPRRLFAGHVLPCCKALLLPLPPSFLLADCQIQPTPNDSHTLSTLSALSPQTLSDF